MARAIRSVTIDRGRDPRLFTMVAFGGNGAVHAVDLARMLDVPRVLVPVLPGVFTAVGMLASDVEHHFVRSTATRLEGADLVALSAVMDSMRAEGLGRLADDGYRGPAATMQFLADLRFLGQGSELTVPLPGASIGAEDVPALARSFLDEYARTYGHVADDPLELVNLRLIASGHRSDRLDFARLGGVVQGRPAAAARRAVYLGRDDGFQEVPVVDRMAIGREVLEGPAIIESYESTVVIPRGARASSDGIGNILIEVA
jgi:N-methylhydantoinase A